MVENGLTKREIERRLIELEKTIPNLIQRIDHINQVMIELKNIMTTGNRETMDFMKSVIGHEQNMDVVKQQLKTEQQKAEIELNRLKDDWEREQKAEKEKWEREQDKWKREQKAENRAVIRGTVTKVLLITAPILTALVTMIVKLLDGM